MTTALRSVLCGAVLACMAGTASAGFADPLDTPAIASALSDQHLINGLARAGDRVIAVGQRGHILLSDDDGAHWAQAKVPVSSDLTAVSFPTARDGWAVGHDGVVLASHDGGTSWTRQLDGRSLGKLLVKWYAAHRPEGWDDDRYARLQADAQRFADEGPDQPFLDVWFADADHGYIVGAFNLVLATSDGGEHWMPWLDRSDNPKAYHLYAIRQVGGSIYAVGEQGLVLKLDADAQRLRALALPYGGTLFGITGDDAGVIVYGLRGHAWRSTDHGASWQALDTHLDASLSAATTFDHRIMLIGQTGQVLISSDGGATLAPAPVDVRVPASAVLSLGPDRLLIGGPLGLKTVRIGAGTQNTP